MVEKAKKAAVDFGTIWTAVTHVAMFVSGWVSIAWWYDNQDDVFTVVPVLGSILLVNAVVEFAMLHTRRAE